MYMQYRQLGHFGSCHILDLLICTTSWFDENLIRSLEKHLINDLYGVSRYTWCNNNKLHVVMSKIHSPHLCNIGS